MVELLKDLKKDAINSDNPDLTHQLKVVKIKKIVGNNFKFTFNGKPQKLTIGETIAFFENDENKSSFIAETGITEANES